MIRAIFEEYGPCTVRQVYYVGSRRGWWEKDYRTRAGRDKRNSYQRVSRWLTEMRERGDIPYRNVLEFGRKVKRPLVFETAEEYSEYTARAFSFDLWMYQPTYVEVWVEGEAIAPVVEKALEGLRVPLMMNKGHCSTTAIIESAKRLEWALTRHVRTHHPDCCDRQGRFRWHDLPPEPLIRVLYVGDHDAAGTCMDVNLVERLRLHSRLLDYCIYEDWQIFERIAVTLEQVEEHDLEPDPKPVSATSSLGKPYVERFGHRNAWAFEALPPDVAQEIIRDAVEDLIDADAWNRALELEESACERLAAGKGLIG
jgi:hypothetical protein